jgi:hypothetical protein
MLNGVFNNSAATQPIQGAPAQTQGAAGMENFGAGIASGANQVLGQQMTEGGVLPGQATPQATLGQGLFQDPAAAQQDAQAAGQTPTAAAGQAGAATDPFTGVSMPQNPLGTQPQGESREQMWGNLYQNAQGQDQAAQTQAQGTAQADPAGLGQAPAETGPVTVQEITEKTPGPKGNEAPKGDITKKEMEPIVGPADPAATKDPAVPKDPLAPADPADITAPVDPAVPINPEDVNIGDKIILKGALKHLPEEDAWLIEAGGKTYEIFGLPEELLKDGLELELLGTVKEGRPDLDADFGFDVEEIKNQENQDAAPEAPADTEETINPEAAEAVAGAEATATDLPVNPDEPKVDELMIIKGKLQNLGLEGGGWIVDTGNGKFAIQGVPEEYLEDGKDVEFKGRVKELVTALMAGHSFNVEEIIDTENINA